MAALDFKRVREAAGDDPEFIQELMELYLEDAAERLQELRAAVSNGSTDEVARSAHKLKGSSANVGAQGISDCAKTLEEMGKNGDLQGAEALVDRAQADLDLVKTELQTLLDSL
ncbi:MAG: Hpt domain-containing protein [Myxococcota bacterium]